MVMVSFLNKDKEVILFAAAHNNNDGDDEGDVPQR